MRNDPFIALGLAEFDVIEFQASQSHPLQALSINANARVILSKPVD